MIEKLVTSKTRIKILKLFLSNIDDRYYLRQLERILGESLSPLRRQLVKMASMGILITEEEANLKYYRLNKNFEGLDDLKKIVLGIEEEKKEENAVEIISAGPVRQLRYDLALLSFISIFVLITAIFLVYANNKNIKQVANLLSESKPKAAVVRKTEVINGEMMSKKWKIFPGNIPVLSSVETGKDKKSEEL